jgi:hypothetical protein
MAANNGNSKAAFQEMLEVRIDLKQFEKDLIALRDMFQDFVKSLGQGGGQVFEAMGLNKLAKQLEGLEKEVSEFNLSVVQSYNQMAEKVGAIQEAVTEKQKREGSKRVANAKADIEAEKKAIVDALQSKEGREKFGLSAIPSQSARDIRTEAEGTVNETAARNAKANLETIKNFEKELERVSHAEEQLADKRRGRLEEELAQAEASYLAQKKANDQTIQNFQNELKALDRLDVAKQKAAAQEARINTRARADEVAETNRAVIDGINREMAALNKRVAVDHQLDESQTKSINRRLTSLGKEQVALEKQIAAAKRREEAERKAADAAERRARKEQEAADRAANKAVSQQQNQFLRETHKLESDIAVQRKKSAGFIQQWVDGLRQSVIHATRFFVVWQGLQLLLDAAKLAITAPFKALGEGVKFLQDIEKDANDMLAPILAAVKFSDDFATNLERARQAAQGTSNYIREQSASLGINEENVRNTTKALLEGGAAKTVGGDMKKLADLAIIFQQTLTAAGVGLLSAQGSVEEIAKLFKGNVAETSKWLQALRDLNSGFSLTNLEWRQIRDASKEHGTLLEDLKERLQPYQTALASAKGGQVQLIEQFKLLVKQIEAAGARDIFAFITDGIKKFSVFLKENENIFASWLRIIGESIQQFVALIVAIGQNKLVQGVLAGILTVAKILVDTLLLAGDLIMQIANTITDVIVNVLTKPLSQAFDGIAAKWEGFAARLKKTVGSDIEAVGLLFGVEPKKAQAGPEPGKGSAKGGGPPLVSLKGVYKAELDDMRQQFEGQLDFVRDTFDAFRKIDEEKVAEERMSLKARADRVRSTVEAEKTQLIARLAIFKKEWQEKVKEIVGQGKTPEEQAQLAKQYDTAWAKIQETVRNRLVALNLLIIKADKDVAKESARIQQENFAHRLRMTRLDLDKQRRLIDESQREGFLSESQALEEQIRVTREAMATDLKEATAEVERLQAEGGDKYNAALNKREESARRYSNEIELLSHQRIEAGERELRAANEHAIEMAAIDNDRAEAILKLQEQLSGRALSSAFEELTRKRLDNLNALIAEKGEQLEVLKRRKEDTVLVQQQTEALERLKTARLDLIQAQLQQIDNTSATPLFAQIRRRAALKDAAPNLSQDELRRLNQSEFGTRDAFRGLGERLFGTGFFEAWGKATSTVGKFAVASEGVVGVLANLRNVISSVRQGAAEGGTLGGIGGGISAVSGLLGSKLLSKIPVIGEFLPAIGGVLSIVGSLFTAAAKRIAEDVKKSFQRTLDNYQNGNASLIQTITDLESQRISAITRLSGKKGGKDELDKLLPEFDREITNLKKQQDEITRNFIDGLVALRQQNDTLEQVHKRWADINKQVREYIGAGGDAALAAEFLSRSLEKIRQDAAEELSRAEQDAIQDAIKLNDLLEQRIDLEDEFKKKEFDLINADAIERRQAGAVTRGKELEALRKQHQEQLDNINSEITLIQKKVDKEKEVFDLAASAAELRRRDEELTLQNLDKQIDKWKTLKDIVNGIVRGEDGLFSAAFLPAPTSLILNITVNAPPGSDPEEFGSRVGDAVYDELVRNGRMVPA